MKAKSVQQRVLDLIHHDPVLIRSGIEGGSVISQTDKCLRLGLLVGRIGQTVIDCDFDGEPKWLTHTRMTNALKELLGYSCGWLLSLEFKDLVGAIRRERHRQQRLFKEGTHLFTCSSPVACRARKFRVLLEEGGEVAKAVDQLELAESRESLALPQYKSEVLAELVQVAAVCVAWLESMETNTNEK